MTVSFSGRPCCVQLIGWMMEKVKVMVGRGDLQVNMESKVWCGGGGLGVSHFCLKF
jgi:hypothetical protein